MCLVLDESIYEGKQVRFGKLTANATAETVAMTRRRERKRTSRRGIIGDMDVRNRDLVYGNINRNVEKCMRL